MFIANVNEGSQLILQLSLRDSTGSAVSPTTLRYRVDCKTTATAITGWTTLTPTDDELTIPADSNAIIRDSNAFEIKAVTFQADAGLPTSYTSEHQWKVLNLDGIS